jgi:hypothetical protein
MASASTLAPSGSGMAFTIRQLWFFAAVAEHGTVSRTAEHLSISQSSVTGAMSGNNGSEGFRKGPSVFPISTF